MASPAPAAAAPVAPVAAATSAWAAVSSIPEAHAKAISSVKFSRDGAFVATASADSTIKVWSTQALLDARVARDAADATAATTPTPEASTETAGASVQPLVTLRGHDQGVSDVAWSRDGAYLVSASDDRTLRVWDVAQQKCVSVLGTPTHNSSFLFSGLPLETAAPNSARSAGGVSANGAAASRSNAGGSMDDGADDGHATYVFCCEFNPQGSLIASGSFDETVRLWDVRTGRCLFRITAHQEPVSCIDFNHDGTLLATSSFDGLVRIWDVATMQCLREIILEPSVPATLARFTPNSQFVLVGTMDGRLSLWDYMTPKKPQCVKSYRGHVNKKYCVAAAFLQDGGAGRLVSGSEDGRVVAWDVNTQQQVDAWKTATSSVVIGLSVHPSQRYVVAAAERGLTIWAKPDERVEAVTVET